MIDLGITKLALIGVVALVVIGPEKLPRVARTVGTLLGKAQRYVNEVKAEVNRTMELDELKRMKDSVESAARDVETSIHQTVADVESTWAQDDHGTPVYPEYRHPNKHFRLKQKAVPQWYKARTGTRRHALSGAARVARFRPKPKSF